MVSGLKFQFLILKLSIKVLILLSILFVCFYILHDKVVWFESFACSCSVFPALFIERLSFPCCVFLPLLSETNCPHMDALIF